MSDQQEFFPSVCIYYDVILFAQVFKIYPLHRSAQVESSLSIYLPTSIITRYNVSIKKIPRYSKLYLGIFLKNSLLIELGYNEMTADISKWLFSPRACIVQICSLYNKIRLFRKKIQVPCTSIKRDLSVC